MITANAFARLFNSSNRMNNKDDSKKRYTKESNNDIWENWKRNIDLVKFVCERYGYEIVKKDGYRNNSNNNLLELNDGKYHVALKKFEFNGVRNETVDTILVRRNINQQYFYTNPNNRNDQGNIAQRVARRENTDDFKKVAEILHAYSGNLDSEIITKPQIPVNKAPEIQERVTYTANYFGFTSKLRNPEYLMARGIKKDTLSDPYFNGRVLNIVTRDHKTKKEYINIAFPLFSINGLSGAEITNYGFKGFIEGSQKDVSLWISNIDKSRPVDQLILAEAATDALSYFQLKNNPEQNTIYASFCGNLGEAIPVYSNTNRYLQA